MAWEIPLFKPAGLKAAASLATKQFYGVKVTANNSVNIATVDGEPCVGVLQNSPASGEAAEVMMAGITKVYVGTTLTAGQKWCFNSTGGARPVAFSTGTGADLGDFVQGIVLEGAAAAEYATVTIGIQTGYAGQLGAV